MGPHCEVQPTETVKAEVMAMGKAEALRQVRLAVRAR
jgi:hypothetical protein